MPPSPHPASQADGTPLQADLSPSPQPGPHPSRLRPARADTTHVSGPPPARPQRLPTEHPGHGPASPGAAVPPRPVSGAAAHPIGLRRWLVTGGPSGTRALCGFGDRAVRAQGWPAARAHLCPLASEPETPSRASSDNPHVTGRALDGPQSSWLQAATCRPARPSRPHPLASQGAPHPGIQIGRASCRERVSSPV